MLDRLRTWYDDSPFSDEAAREISAAPTARPGPSPRGRRAGRRSRLRPGSWRTRRCRSSSACPAASPSGR
ncbi:hypothetical protein ACRAWD_16305 [Caulobacter segnis]